MEGTTLAVTKPNTPNPHIEPAVWLGCLACYNNGNLIGGWMPAVEAGDIDSETLHKSVIPSWDKGNVHEELWVFDHENLPISGECDPLEAQAWGKLLDGLEDYERDAAIKWMDHVGITSPGDFDPQAFEDVFNGVWESFEAFAWDMAEQVFPELSNCGAGSLASYFDEAAWQRDLGFDYFTEDTINGVYVYRSA